MLKQLGAILQSADHWLQVQTAIADNNRMLREAVAGGDLVKVNELLAYPEVMKDIAANNNEFLTLACEKGHLPVVKRLLKIPAVLETITADNNAPLRKAAANGRLLVVNKLLKIPVVVTMEENNRANLALKEAAINNQLAVFYRLLDIPQIKTNFMTHDIEALDTAAAKGLEVVVHELLQSPAVRTKLQNNSPLNPPLHFALQSQHHPIILKIFNAMTDKQQNAVVEFVPGDLQPHLMSYYRFKLPLEHALERKEREEREYKRQRPNG